MWLITAELKQQLEQAHRAGITPTVQQQADYVAAYGPYESNTSKILTIAGNVAEIRISGAITKSPSFMAMLFGGGNVTYPEIIAALAEADANPEVERAELRVDSPGGHVDGMFEALAALEGFSKPTKAIVVNQAASAAYAIVSQTDEIVALNRAARVGSIGVAASFYLDGDTIDITSTNAPNKRPDLTTEAGQKVIREELDALHDLFVESIAAGRDTTPDKINAEYGRGSVLLADEALKRGMIDAIAGAPLRIVSSAESNTTAERGGNQPETFKMDLKTLQAQHPDVYAAAVEAGRTEERDRVSAHLTMGEASGDMKTALAAVADGSLMTAGLTAKYMAAGMGRRDQSNRQDDDAAASAAADEAAAAAESTSGEDVLALVEQRLGITE